MEEAGLPVDISTLEGDPLLRPEAGEGAHDRDRPVLRAELRGHGLDVLHLLEARNLAPLRLRVGDGHRDVLVQEPCADGVVEDLPQRLVDRVGGAFG